MVMLTPNNKDFSCLLQLLFIGILFVGTVVICHSLLPKPSGKPLVNVSYRVHIQPTPAPTATPNPYFTILLERAKAAATVEVIKADADAQSQAINDEIKLKWNVHYMRRFWAWYAIPVLLALSVGLAVYVLGYQRR
jgi:hypothetical protein